MDQINIQKIFNYVVNATKKRDAKVLKRIIPQIYYEEMYDYVEEVYPFDQYVWATYQIQGGKNPGRTFNEILIFLMNHPKVKTLLLPKESTTPIINYELTNTLKIINVLVYVHTPNNMAEIKYFYDLGVWGFVTDYITEDYIKNHQLLRYQP